MPQCRSSIHILGNSPFGQPGDDVEEPQEPRGSELVDVEDPAFLFICRAAAGIADFGYDPSDPDVASRIIKVGRQHYEEARDRATAAAKARVKAGLPAAMPGEVVYYMRIGNRVKIGWSTNLRSRLVTINPEELMAVEPGGYLREQHRHGEFAHLRTHGEWFRLDDTLVVHIKVLRDAAKASPVTEPVPALPVTDGVAALGAGCDVALGAMHAALSLGSAPEQAVDAAVRIACQHIDGCHLFGADPTRVAA